MGRLATLAALHGVATVHSPGPDVAVPVPDETVVAVLAALGVDASTDEAVQAALTSAEAAAASRLLPPTVVVWTTPDPGTAGAVLPPALPCGTGRAAAGHAPAGGDGAGRDGRLALARRAAALPARRDLAPDRRGRPCTGL